MITQKTVQEVMQTARVEDVIGDFIHLKRRGINLIGNCPFHDEKTPSFTVSPSKNIYKCFGCGKGGDPVRFIMDHEKMSFLEAIRYLAARYRIEVEETEQTAEEVANRQLTDSYYLINEFAREYFENVLFQREEGRAIGLAYFKERGFRESTIRQFQLGYATEERDGLTTTAVRKQYNINHLHTLGLTTKSDADFFRSRVIFPIHNVSGKVVAFAGRTLSSDKKQPKYINSPESEIYNKRSVLYGLYFAKEAIRRADECILVEGYTDVITLHQGEIRNVVASSGTSLTQDQIRLIKRYTPNIKIIYDGDAAGIKAALRGLDLVLASDMNVKLVLLPDGHDPDSFLALQGTEAFLEYLREKEEDFVFFKTRVLLKETGDDPIRKSGVIKDIVGSVAKIRDAFKRALYIRQCSTMLQIQETILHAEVNKVIRSELRQQQLTRHESSVSPSEEESWLTTKQVHPVDEPMYVANDAWQEKSICSVLVNYGHHAYHEERKETVAKFIIEQVKDLLPYFDVPLYTKIVQLVDAELQQGHSPESSWYTAHSDDELRDFAINALSSPYTYASWEAKEMYLQTQKPPDENFIPDAANAVLRLQFRKSRKVIQELQTYFANAKEEDQSSEEYIINVKVMQVLIQKRNELAAKLGTVVIH